MEETDIILRGIIPWWGALFLGIILIFVLIAGYRRTTRPVSGWLKTFLISLRIGAVAILLLCLLMPAIQTTTYRIVRKPLVFLVDTSRSMQEVRDTPDGKSRLKAIESLLKSNQSLVDKLAQKYEVRTFHFARDLGIDQNKQKYASDYSAYGRAIKGALDQTNLGQGGGCMVVFGDGSHNLGPPEPLEVAATLADLNIPLYTVGVGQEEIGGRIRDVKVVSIDAPRRAYVFSKFSVRAKILFRGCQGKTVDVKLELPDQTQKFQKVTVAHDEEIVPVQFDVTPEEEGELKIIIRAAEVADEIIPENNVRSKFVKVVSSGIRLGYFESLRPEGKFVYAALRNAPQINLLRILVAPGDQIPAEKLDWTRYDAVFLGNVPPQAFGSKALETLKAQVMNKGTGLALLIGPENAGRSGFSGSILETILPVSLPPKWSYEGNKHKFVPAPDALGHPVIALGGTKQETDALWKKMPPLSGILTGVEARRQASVLATDRQKNPLLCAQRVGAGGTLIVLTDTTFKWYFTAKDTQEQFTKFWRQVALWTGGIEKEEKEAFQLVVSKGQVGLGEPITLQAHLTASDGSPIRDATVNITVTPPESEPQKLESLFSRELGYFQASYVPEKSGPYLVSAKATRSGKIVGEDTASFQASRADRELSNPVANLSLLRRLSAATSEAGGKYYPHTRLRQMLEDLQETGDPVRLKTNRWNEIWDSPFFFLAFLILIGSEWALRKWQGLV
ncbi:MAG: VWA domain-containing protein [Planctomycetes bacterium]|nr:VWA domain-containing protein [Planctomycetota bacterium]